MSDNELLHVLACAVQSVQLHTKQFIGWTRGAMTQLNAAAVEDGPTAEAGVRQEGRHANPCACDDGERSSQVSNDTKRDARSSNITHADASMSTDMCDLLQTCQRSAKDQSQ